MEVNLDTGVLASQDLQVEQAASILAANAQLRNDAPRRDNNLISTAELEGIATTNLLDVVQSLRPQWLRGRGAKTLQTVTVTVGGETLEIPRETPIVVYQENIRLGDLHVLRDLSPTGIASIQYLDSRAATQRWGTGHVGGAILLSMKSGR